MDRRQILALTATVALAACGGGRNDQQAAADSTRDTTASSAVAPDTTTTAEAAAAGMKPLDTTAAAVQSGPEITVSRTPENGTYLADRAGRPLYLYTADRDGQSACYDACAALWPPVIALQGTASAGSDRVQASMLGTTRRRDGSMQVTYNKHPLYYYQNDQGASKPTGNDVKDAGGEWYLVTPQGEKAEEHGEGGEDKS